MAILFHPPGLTKYRLAHAIGVPRQRIDEIVSGKRTARFQRQNQLQAVFQQAQAAIDSIAFPRPAVSQ